MSHKTNSSLTENNTYKDCLSISSIRIRLLIVFVMLIGLSVSLRAEQSPNGYTYQHNWQYYSNFATTGNGGYSELGRLTLDINQNGYEFDKGLVQTDADNLVLHTNIDCGLASGRYKLKVRIGKQIGDEVVNQGTYLREVYYEHSTNYFSFPAVGQGTFTLSFDLYSPSGQHIRSGYHCFDKTNMLQTLYVNENRDLLFKIRSANSVFKRPMLCVEGFDPLNSKSITFYQGKILEIQNIDPNVPDPFENVDLYLLDFKDATIDMRENSMVVLGAIKYLSTLYDAEQFREGISVLGFSMGGVISRYALAYAEQNNVQHKCSQLISYDSPHRGALLNTNLQNKIYDIYEDITSLQKAIDAIEVWSWIFVPAGLVINLVTGDFNDTLDDYKAMFQPILNTIEAPASKQLLRYNVNSDEYTNELQGSIDYRQFYSEINEEERINYNPDTPNGILNKDINYPNSKPGYPYKQNQIKCIAVSNGWITQSGDSQNIHDHICTLDLPTFWYLQDINIDEKDWDTQPGSTFGMSSWTGEFGQYIDIHYDPVFVPLKSSSHLRPIGENGSPLNNNLTINNYNDIVPVDNNGNVLTDHQDISEYLSNHSLFDAVALSNVPDLRHDDISDIVVSNAIELFNNPTYRSISQISGNIVGTDYDDIEISAYIGQTQQQIEPEFLQMSVDGHWSLAYTLLQDSDIKLKFIKPGSIPTIKKFHVEYDEDAGQADSISDIQVRILDFNLQNIMVSASGQVSFTTVNDAIQFLQEYYATHTYNGEAVKIRVLPGTYHENVDLSLLLAMNITNFTLEGIGEVIIDGLGFEYCINLEYSYVNPLDELMDLKIININMTNAKHGVYFKDLLDEFDDYAPHGKLTIRNCGFQNCGGNDYENTFGGGVHFSGAGSIEYNVFADNNMDNNQWVNSNRAGALYLHNDSSAEADVKGNTFTDNTGGFAGALVATGSGRIWVRGNYFEDNIESGFVSDRKTGNSLSVYDVSKISITNNVFIDNRSIPGQTSGKEVALDAYAAIHSDVEPIIFENNTLISSNQTNLLSFWHSSNNAIQDIEIRNNVFSNTGQGNSTVSSLNYGNPTVEYNIFHDTVPTGFAGSFSTTNIEEDPKLDANHQPIWTASIMSPCIDAGYGDDDPDDTPRDIGAITAQEHAYREYSYANPSSRDRWHWVSYPVLNTVSNYALQASEFFEELLQVHQILENGIYVDTPTYLDEIDWMEEGELQSIEWYNENWTSNQYTHYVSSPQGYKVKLLQNVPDTVTLIESGFKTPENLRFSIHGGVENWLGYFKEDPAKPNEVFADIWDDIIMVRGKSWSLVRDSNGELTGKMGTLHYGEMVSILTTNSHTFRWGSSNPTPPALKSMPQHFAFDEKPDYIPLYVSLPDSLMPDLKEIGLYLDGVCKGAVVVDSDYEQISVYVNSEGELTNSDLELIFHYDESKRPDQELRTTSYHPGKMQPQYGISGARYPFYEISISQKDLDNVKPPVFALKQNYPNPFNPSTSISYWLPETARVRLDIYNLKGQLVKTLIDSEMEAGPHSVVWNGKDGNDQAVASGVYFYRLSSPNNTQTKRMLLMK